MVANGKFLIGHRFQVIKLILNHPITVALVVWQTLRIYLFDHSSSKNE